MSTYVEIKAKEFEVLMNDMDFLEIQLDGTFERVWEFKIKNSNFSIRVYSTITNGVSRESGTDAIRCMIYDNVNDKIIKLEKRVHRTISALKNTRIRCRELWKHIRDNKCSCGGTFLERENKHKHKFMGCSNYPTCKKSKNIIVSQLKLKFKK